MFCFVRTRLQQGRFIIFFSFHVIPWFFLDLWTSCEILCLQIQLSTTQWHISWYQRPATFLVWMRWDNTWWTTNNMCAANKWEIWLAYGSIWVVWGSVGCIGRSNFCHGHCFNTDVNDKNLVEVSSFSYNQEADKIGGTHYVLDESLKTQEWSLRKLIMLIFLGFKPSIRFS